MPECALRFMFAKAWWPNAVKLSSGNDGLRYRAFIAVASCTSTFGYEPNKVAGGRSEVAQGTPRL
jgi:hypothetical protein